MENKNYYIKNGHFFENKENIKKWVNNRIVNSINCYYAPLLLKGMKESVNSINDAVKKIVK